MQFTTVNKKLEYLFQNVQERSSQFLDKENDTICCYQIEQMIEIDASKTYSTSELIEKEKFK